MRLSALKYWQHNSGHSFAFRKTAIKALKQDVKPKPNKCTTTFDFRLASAFFTNLEHFSQPTLVLLFKL